MTTASDFGDVTAKLFETISARRGGDSDASYTARLFAKGRVKIVNKFGEEAFELASAALSEAPENVVSESADLIYHLLVLWAETGIRPEDVAAELERRVGTSGLDEKKSRQVR